jgi:phosphoribosyl 1,2-cyclic phosphodiesterase
MDTSHASTAPVLSMPRTGVGAAPPETHSPIASARITFWGVQGSVPISPDYAALSDYQACVARHGMGRLLNLLRDPSYAEIARSLLAAPPERHDWATAELASLVGPPSLPLYGGETTCISFETHEGNVLVFDGGTGLRCFASELDRRWAGRADRTVHLFFTHEHLDHRNGLPFSRLCYARPNPFDMRIYGTRQLLAALDDRYGIFTHRLSETIHFDDPVDYRAMSAKFFATEFRQPGDGRPVPWEVRATNEPVLIGSTSVRPFDLYHGATRCLAYEVIHLGKKFVLCTDHEFRRAVANPHHAEVQRKSEEAEAMVRAACADADVAYFDAQYRLAEYLGQTGIGRSGATPRVDWGHGTIEDAIDRARACNIQRTFLGHHDPERPWSERRALDAELAEESGRLGRQLQLANDEESIEL